MHGKFALHPVNGRRIPIICDAELVDMAFGTGAVKVRSREGGREGQGGAGREGQSYPPCLDPPCLDPKHSWREHIQSSAP